MLTNAINCEKYAFSESQRNVARHEIGADENTVVLACIGRICAVKNISFALDVVKKLPDNYLLLIVGGGEIEQLKQEILEKQIEGKVVVFGERKDIDTIMNGIDLLLLPSISEGLPMVVLEAQANGIKCIISDNVSAECKVLDNAEFISIDNEDKWVDCILNSNYKRVEDAVHIMKEKGFDIKDYSSRIMEIIDLCIQQDE